MAGYVIHLAVAEAYIKKHPNDITNYNEFIRGVVFPDSVSDKSLTHYGEKSSKVHLDKFLSENNLDGDYNKGYFLHLVTDYLFYNKFLECFSKDIYNDYDILNKPLQEKYNVKITDDIKDKVFYKTGITKILNLQDVINFIETTSEYKLEDIQKEILNHNEFWLEIRQLRKI